MTIDDTLINILPAPIRASNELTYDEKLIMAKDLRPGYEESIGIITKSAFALGDAIEHLREHKGVYLLTVATAYLAYETLRRSG